MEENELPSGWVETPVYEIAELLRGVSYSKDVAKDVFAEGHVAILRATNIQDEHLVLDTDLVYVPHKFVKQEQLLEPDDVVICMSSGSKHLVGKTAQLKSSWYGSFGTFCAVVRFPPILNRQFAGYFFGSARYREFIRDKSSGININNLRHNDIEDLQFPLAPLSEQQRIVAAIEQQFTRLDAGVAALKSAKTRLKRYRAAVLKTAVEGKLTEAWRAEHPTSEPASQLLARILQERRAKWEADLRAKGKDPARVKYVELAPDVSVLSELPERWCWTNILNVTIYGPQNGLYLPSEAYGTGVPILRIDDFQNDFSKSSSQLRLVNANEEDIARYKLDEGDLIINRVNSPSHLGKCIVLLDRNLPALFESNMMRLRLTPTISSKFVEIYLHSSIGRSYLTKNAKWAVNQASINQNDVTNTLLPLPSLAEQQQIVTEVERRLSLVSQLEVLVEANLKRAERLRQSVLKEAFSGRLVPQDPDDEPASVLLERIQQEREVADNGNKGRKQSKQHRTDSNSHTALKQATPQEAYAGNRMAQEPEPLDESEIAQVALWNAD